MNYLDIITLILVGFVGIILGGLIDQLINNITDKRKSSHSIENQDALLSLQRKSDTGRLLISVAGKEIDTSENLDNNQQETTKQLVLELNEWLGLTQDLQMERGNLPIDKDEDKEKEVADEALPRPSFNPVTVLVKALQADVKKSELPTKSIVTQINDILQADLKNSPQIKDPVCLMEWPGIGMVVMIGLEKYESVDDVPDQDIRDIIHDAVKKWEQQGLQEKK